MPSSMLELTKSDLTLEADSTSAVPESSFARSIILAFPGYPSRSTEIFFNIEDPYEPAPIECKSRECDLENTYVKPQEDTEWKAPVEGKARSEQLQYNKDGAINGCDDSAVHLGIECNINVTGNETQYELEAVVQPHLAEDSEQWLQIKSRCRRGWTFERGDARRTTRPNIFDNQIGSTSEQKGRLLPSRSVYTFLKATPPYFQQEARDRSAERRHKEKCSQSPTRKSQSLRGVCENCRDDLANEEAKTRNTAIKLSTSSDQLDPISPSKTGQTFGRAAKEGVIFPINGEKTKDYEAFISVRENIHESGLCKNLDFDLEVKSIENEKCTLPQPEQAISEANLCRYSMVSGVGSVDVPGNQNETSGREVDTVVQQGLSQTELASLPRSEESNNQSLLAEKCVVTDKHQALMRHMPAKMQNGQYQTGHVTVLDHGSEPGSISCATISQQQDGSGVITKASIFKEARPGGVRDATISIDPRLDEIRTLVSINQFQPDGVETLTKRNQSQPNGVATLTTSNQSQPDGVAPVTTSNQYQPDGVATLTTSNQSQTDGVVPLTTSNQSQPDSVATLSNINQSQPDDVTTLTASNQCQPDGVATLTTSNQSQPDGVAPLTTSNQTQPDGVATLTTSTQSQPDGVATLTTSNQSQPDGFAALKNSNQSQSGGVRTLTTSNQTQQYVVATLTTTNQSQPDGVATLTTSNQTQQYVVASVTSNPQCESDTGCADTVVCSSEITFSCNDALSAATTTCPGSLVDMDSQNMSASNWTREPHGACHYGNDSDLMCFRSSCNNTGYTDSQTCTCNPSDIRSAKSPDKNIDTNYHLNADRCHYDDGGTCLCEDMDNSGATCIYQNLDKTNNTCRGKANSTYLYKEHGNLGGIYLHKGPDSNNCYDCCPNDRDDCSETQTFPNVASCSLDLVRESMSSDENLISLREKSSGQQQGNSPGPQLELLHSLQGWMSPINQSPPRDPKGKPQKRKIKYDTIPDLSDAANPTHSMNTFREENEAKLQPGNGIKESTNSQVMDGVFYDSVIVECETSPKILHIRKNYSVGNGLNDQIDDTRVSNLPITSNYCEKDFSGQLDDKKAINIPITNQLAESETGRVAAVGGKKCSNHKSTGCQFFDYTATPAMSSNDNKAKAQNNVGKKDVIANDRKNTNEYVTVSIKSSRLHRIFSKVGGAPSSISHEKHHQVLDSSISDAGRTAPADRGLLLNPQRKENVYRIIVTSCLEKARAAMLLVRSKSLRPIKRKITGMFSGRKKAHKLGHVPGKTSDLKVASVPQQSCQKPHASRLRTNSRETSTLSDQRCSHLIIDAGEAAHSQKHLSQCSRVEKCRFVKKIKELDDSQIGSNYFVRQSSPFLDTIPEVDTLSEESNVDELPEDTGYGPKEADIFQGTTISRGQSAWGKEDSAMSISTMTRDNQILDERYTDLQYSSSYEDCTKDIDEENSLYNDVSLMGQMKPHSLVNAQDVAQQASSTIKVMAIISREATIKRRPSFHNLSELHDNNFSNQLARRHCGEESVLLNEPFSVQNFEAFESLKMAMGELKKPAQARLFIVQGFSDSRISHFIARTTDITRRANSMATPCDTPMAQNVSIAVEAHCSQTRDGDFDFGQSSLTGDCVSLTQQKRQRLVVNATRLDTEAKKHTVEISSNEDAETINSSQSEALTLSSCQALTCVSKNSLRTKGISSISFNLSCDTCNSCLSDVDSDCTTCACQQSSSLDRLIQSESCISGPVTVSMCEDGKTSSRNTESKRGSIKSRTTATKLFVTDAKSNIVKLTKDKFEAINYDVTSLKTLTKDVTKIKAPYTDVKCGAIESKSAARNRNSLIRDPKVAKWKPKIFLPEENNSLVNYIDPKFVTTKSKTLLPNDTNCLIICTDSKLRNIKSGSVLARSVTTKRYTSPSVKASTAPTTCPNRRPSVGIKTISSGNAQVVHTGSLFISSQTIGSAIIDLKFCKNGDLFPVSTVSSILGAEDEIPTEIKRSKIEILTKSRSSRKYGKQKHANEATHCTCLGFSSTRVSKGDTINTPFGNLPTQSRCKKNGSVLKKSTSSNKNSKVHDLPKTVAEKAISFNKDSTVNELQTRANEHVTSSNKDSAVHKLLSRANEHGTSANKSSNLHEHQRSIEIIEQVCAFMDPNSSPPREVVKPLISELEAQNETPEDSTENTTLSPNKQSNVCHKRQASIEEHSLFELSVHSEPSSFTRPSLENCSLRSNRTDHQSTQRRLTYRMRLSNQTSCRRHDYVSRSSRHLERCDKLIQRSTEIIASSKEMALFCQQQMENTAQKMNLQTCSVLNNLNASNQV